MTLQDEFEGGKQPVELMSFRDIERAVRDWARYNFPDTTAEKQFFGMVEELGELAHAVLKADQGIRGYSPEDTAEAQDAVGDLLIFLINFCDRNNWDVLNVLRDTWAEVRERDWIKFPENGLDK